MSTIKHGGASASNNPRPNVPSLEASANVLANTEMPTQVSIAASTSTTQQAPLPSSTTEEHVRASSKKRTRGSTRPSTLQEACAPGLKKAEIAEERLFYQCNIAFSVARTGTYKRYVHVVSAAATTGALITPAGLEAFPRYVNVNLRVLEKVGALEDVGVVRWLPKQIDHHTIKVDAAGIPSLQPHCAEDDAYDLIREDMMRFSQ
ncbi:hypothetical protein L7F22_003739 [Adiantum nelumboides]|nr:hypothetical protein [Adiantum nelumboides]